MVFGKLLSKIRHTYFHVAVRVFVVLELDEVIWLHRVVLHFLSCDSMNQSLVHVQHQKFSCRRSQFYRAQFCHQRLASFVQTLDEIEGF